MKTNPVSLFYIRTFQSSAIQYGSLWKKTEQIFQEKHPWFQNNLIKTEIENILSVKWIYLL